MSFGTREQWGVVALRVVKAGGKTHFAFPPSPALLKTLVETLIQR
jgi:hypothetical protein